MSNVRDDAPPPKIPVQTDIEDYLNPTHDPDSLALDAAREIDAFYMDKPKDPPGPMIGKTQRTAKIQNVVLVAMNKARHIGWPPMNNPMVRPQEDAVTSDTIGRLNWAEAVLTPPVTSPSDLGLVTEVELAAALRVTPQALAVWRAADEGPVWVKLGRGIYYKRSDVDDWINGNRSV